MIVTLDLAPEVAERLHSEAARQNIEVADVVSRLADTLPTPSPEKETYGSEAQSVEPMPVTGAELLAYWKKHDAFGLFADRPEDAPELARILRERQQVRLDLGPITTQDDE